MKRQSVGATLGVSLAILLCGSSAHALPNWTFDLLPVDGIVSGAPGSTMGWGYTITNEATVDAGLWLMLTGVSADPFLHGTPDSSVFDYPILGPQGTRSVPYDGFSGLYALTWDADAPNGFSNTGTFLVNAEWWDGDPLSGGDFVDGAPDRTTRYFASVTSVAVPEPSTVLLLISGLVGLGLFVGRRAAGALAG